MQSQALDLRVLPFQVDSPSRPHQFAIPSSSPSSRYHRANGTINNDDNRSGMPDRDQGMYTDVRVFRFGKFTEFHSCSNSHKGQMKCIENHRVRFFRLCEFRVNYRQEGNPEPIPDRPGPFGEIGEPNVEHSDRLYPNSNNVPSSVPSEGPYPAQSQVLCNGHNCSSAAAQQLPVRPPPPPPPPTPSTSLLNPMQPRPDFSMVPDSATIKQLLEMLPPRQPSPCLACASTPVSQPVINNSSSPQNLPPIQEVTRLQMLLTNPNQYAEHVRDANENRLSCCSRPNCNSTECNVDNCQIRLVSTTSPHGSTVAIGSPQPPSTPLRIASEQQSPNSRGIIIPVDSSQSDTEVRGEVEQMTLRRASPSPSPPAEETGESGPVSPQTAAAFAAANTLVTMTIPKKVKQCLEGDSLEQASPQPPPRTPLGDTYISTTAGIPSPSQAAGGSGVVTDIAPVAPLQQQSLPPMRPPSMVPPPPLINNLHVTPFSGHQQQRHSPFPDHQQQRHLTFPDHQQQRHLPFTDHHQQRHLPFPDHQQQRHSPFPDHQQQRHSQSYEFNAMHEREVNNMYLQEQQRQHRAAQHHAQQSFHQNQEEMPPIPPILQQSLQQQHQQFAVNPRSVPQYNPNLDIFPGTASQQKSFSKRFRGDLCDNGNTVYGEAPPLPQRRLLPQLQHPHSMSNHNNLSGMHNSELLYSSASFQQQQQQQQQTNRYAQYPQQRYQFQQNTQPQTDYHRSSPYPIMGGQLQNHLQQHQQRFESARQSPSALNPYASWTSMNSTSNTMSGTSSRQLIMSNSDVIPPRFVTSYNRSGNSSGGGVAGAGRRHQPQQYHPYHNNGNFSARNVYNVPAQLQQLQQQQQQYQQLQRRPPPACTATSQHPGHGHYELLRAEPPSMFGAGDLEMGGFQANECLITREVVDRGRESVESRQVPSLPPATVTEDVRMPRTPIAPIVPSLLGGSSSTGFGAGLPGITLTPVTSVSEPSSVSARIRGTPLSVVLTTSQRNAIANASNAMGDTDLVQQQSKPKGRGRGSRGGGTGSRSRGGGSRPVGRPPKQRNDNATNDNNKPKRSRKRKGEQAGMSSTRGRGGKRGEWRGINLPPYDATLFASSSGPSNPQTRIMPIDSLQGAGGTITTQAVRPAPAASIPVVPGNLMLNGSETGQYDQVAPPTQRPTSLPRHKATRSETDRTESESPEENEKSRFPPAVLSESTSQSRPKQQGRKKKAKPDCPPLPPLLPLHEPSAPPKSVTKKSSKKVPKQSSSSQSQSDEVKHGTFELNAMGRIVQQFSCNNNNIKENPPNETQTNSQNLGEENQESFAPQIFRINDLSLTNITAISVQHNAYEQPLGESTNQLPAGHSNSNRGASSLSPMSQGLYTRPGLIEPEPSCPLIREILRPIGLSHSPAFAGPSQFDISMRPVNNPLVSYPNSMPPLITLRPCWEDQRRPMNPFDESFQNSMQARPQYPQQDMVPFNVANEVEIQADPCGNEELEKPNEETGPEGDQAGEARGAPQERPEAPQEEPGPSTKKSGKSSCATSEEESSYDGFGELIICEEPEERNNNENNENNEDNQDQDPVDPADPADPPPKPDPKPSTSKQ